jgi:hypothetical protein
MKLQSETETGTLVSKRRTVTQAVGSPLLTAETRSLSQANPCKILGGQSGTGTGFSLSTSGFSCQYHSTSGMC